MSGIVMSLVIWLYTTYFMIKEKEERAVFKTAIILLASAGAYWAAGGMGTLLMCVGISFTLRHTRNRRVSILYWALFYGMMGLLGFMAWKAHSVTLYAQGLSLIGYLLTETNYNYMRKSYEDAAAEYQNKILNQQVEEVQNIYFTMRGWRHDYHNHLQTLKAHLKMGQVDLASEYLGHLENDLDHVNEMIESGNVYLDAILNSKLSLAMKQDIEITYRAVVPEHLIVTEIDLCVLIGNLIDNAVESCEKMTEGRRFIRIYIGVLKNQLYLSVTNGTGELVRKLDEEYITTKRGNHGHGLKRINKIVEKYEGYINRKNEPGVFVTEIMLPL